MAVHAVPGAGSLGLIAFLHHMGGAGVRAEGPRLFREKELGIVIIPDYGIVLLSRLDADANVDDVVGEGDVRGGHHLLEEGKAPPARRDDEVAVADLPRFRGQDAVPRVKGQGTLAQRYRRAFFGKLGHEALDQGKPAIGAQVGLADGKEFDTDFFRTMGVTLQVLLFEDRGLKEGFDPVEVADRFPLEPAILRKADGPAEIHLAVVAQAAG